MYFMGGLLSGWSDGGKSEVGLRNGMISLSLPDLFRQSIVGREWRVELLSGV
jgi:hypothetical protein